MIIKTLADLKRALTVGTKITMTRHDWITPTSVGDKSLVGMTRTVEIVQTNAVAFSPTGSLDWNGKPRGRSWLTFPKATDFYPTANGFGIYLDKNNSNSVMEYRIENI
jgi:hypothetical protein